MPSRRVIGLLMLGIGVLSAPHLESAALAGGPWPPNRLYRHRSGYFYGYDRPYSYTLDAPTYGEYGGCNGAHRGGGSVSDYPDPRLDFDVRRDRLLRAATRIDVSDLGSTARGRRPSSPANDDAGWAFLRDGAPVKALGRFTALAMRAPGDARTRIGYALAAALYEDDRTAVHAMRLAVRLDAQALGSIDAEVGLTEAIDGLIARYAGRLASSEEIDADAAFMTAALHVLVHDLDGARLALEVSPATGGAPVDALRQMLASRDDGTPAEAATREVAEGSAEAADAEAAAEAAASASLVASRDS